MLALFQFFHQLLDVLAGSARHYQHGVAGGDHDQVLDAHSSDGRAAAVNQTAIAVQ